MKRYFCSCGSEIFFENTRCNNCGYEVGFDPEKLKLFSLSHVEDNGLMQAGEINTSRYNFCSNRDYLNCNWLLKTSDHNVQCQSCRLTRTIPSQDSDKNKVRWNILESRKRRLIYNMLNHGLTYESKTEDPVNGLCFDFLEDKRSNPNVELEHVYTGHSNGVITINAAEADPDYRASVRVIMNEQYRTILGHLRHEIGHYYYDRLVKNTGWIRQFTELFGDPEEDYQKALDNYYNNGPNPGWMNSNITAYSSMHPLEDWAETWAHYLHMKDGLETALSFETINMTVDYSNFDDILNKWMNFTVVLNALNRSIGKIDAYPFVINNSVAGKLKMIHKVIQRVSSKI